MPLETARPRTRLAPELALPPPFTAIRLREVGDAFAHAVAIAPEKGAGTLVYVGRFDLAEFALVLEPDEPLLRRGVTFYAGMAALADALAAHAQPDTSITIDWPDSLLVNKVWSAVDARLAEDDLEERSNAGMACLRRHDPHGVDDRTGAGIESTCDGA